MPVSYEPRGERLEAKLSDDPDDFSLVARMIERHFGGEWLKKSNGPDQSYWDYSLAGVLLTLHREHYLGVTLYPTSAEKDLQRANELVLEIDAHLQSLHDRAHPDEP